jgi:putative component of membrane protein insertase Oxa1/YidC/SpoIIIJ protein YidD
MRRRFPKEVSLDWLKPALLKVTAVVASLTMVFRVLACSTLGNGGRRDDVCS